ncbi:Gfo/Idh/MocA family protein [Protaetiibacter larvae]|uniref:Gfo/Idh/MocA family oxidoreductase n=1 Tax=Protaetiibacter larvae TaxID=2592654 RepID=A0A5C1Y4L2_9MICO|nr:Gfo/Idh/MocA family oxidoreductase [Protaetiibacter larvae]QEO08973.1 Gfo/Idh/MocA family oxidoreductase [Protaetiibacter larvae]
MSFAHFPEPSHVPLRGGPVLRWGVLAPGAIAHDWVTTLHANTDQRVVAVASRTAERAEAFAARHGIPRSYGAYAALVADPEVDVVYIAAPHSEHRALALLAIDAGNHVLIEKPIAVSAAQAAEIALAARTAGVFAMEAMWSRFLPQTTIIRRLLDDGALGEPFGAAATFAGRFDDDPHSRAFDPALGGGGLLDLGVYTVWWLHFTLGGSPSSISASGELAPTGVDADARVVLGWGADVSGSSFTSMTTDLPIVGSVTGRDGLSIVAEPFVAPGRFRIERAGGGAAHWEDETELRWRDGLAYQAAAVASHIAEGRTEAPEHPLQTSIEVLGVIDEARRQLGAA